MRRNERGAVLVLVLAVLAMLGILGAAWSRAASNRWQSAVEYRHVLTCTDDKPAMWQSGTKPCDHR